MNAPEWLLAHIIVSQWYTSELKSYWGGTSIVPMLKLESVFEWATLVYLINKISLGLCNMR